MYTHIMGHCTVWWTGQGINAASSDEVNVVVVFPIMSRSNGTLLPSFVAVSHACAVCVCVCVCVCMQYSKA